MSIMPNWTHFINILLQVKNENNTANESNWWFHVNFDTSTKIKTLNKFHTACNIYSNLVSWDEEEKNEKKVNMKVVEWTFYKSRGLTVNDYSRKSDFIPGKKTRDIILIFPTVFEKEKKRKVST